MKKILLFTALVLMVTSSAFAFSLGSGYAGPVELKFFDWTMGRSYSFDGTTWTSEGYRLGLAAGNQNLLNGVITAGDGVVDSWGIINLASINDPDGNTLWSNSSSEKITGVVWDYDDTYINSTDLGAHAEVLQRGGYLALYLDSTPDLDPTKDFTGMPAGWVASGDTLSFDPWKATNDGVPFIKLKAVPGVSLIDPLATRSEHVNGLTSPFSGQGSGYFEVVEGWGLYDYVLNGNAYNSVNPGADVYTVFDFITDGRNSFDAKSSDPAKGIATPEPSTMLLFAMGIVGLATRIRRKKVA